MISQEAPDNLYRTHLFIRKAISKIFLHKSEDEYAFTLIELLVVILIIGVLASIAIPAFLNQRQRANDVVVKSDVKNSIAIVDYYMTNPDVQTTAGLRRAKEAIRSEVRLSPGVSFAIHGGTTYCITAYHENGKEFVSREKAMTYKNVTGGDGWSAECLNAPAQSEFFTASSS